VIRCRLKDEEYAPANIQTCPAIGDTRSWMTAGLGLALFALAVAVRWWGLSKQTHQMWGDEAQFMSFARDFIQGVYTTPFEADGRGLPALYDLTLSLPLRLVGQMDVTVARAFDGLLGALSVPLLYLTALELGYPRRVGVVAAVSLATTFWDVSFSRLVLPNIMGVSATSVVVLFLVIAVRRSSLAAAVLSGIALAWACNAHLVGMMAVPLVVGWLLLLIGGYSRWWGNSLRVLGPREVAIRRGKGWPAGSSRWLTLRSGGRGRAVPLDLNSTGTRPVLSCVLVLAVALGVIALIAAWPLLQLYWGAGSAVQGHADSRFLFLPENRFAFVASHPDVGSGVFNILWYQFTYAFGLFTVHGQPGGVFNLGDQQLLDSVSGPLFILGVVTALWMWRRPAATLILLWLIVPVVLGTVLTIDPYWSFHRSIIAAPAMCLLIGLGLETVLLALRGSLLLAYRLARKGPGLPPWWPILGAAVATLVTITIGVQGIQHYWNFANAPATHQAFDNETHEWSLFLAPQGALAATVVGPQGWAVEFPNLYAPAASICPGRWGDVWKRCPTARIVIFDNDLIDAQQYAAATHIPVHVVLSPDKVTGFWYAQGRGLPDPAHVLAHLP